MILENLTVKDIFARLAVNGYLGDPGGREAYCYVRVSSAQQADEGRTGLPRQIQHCHEVAGAQHLRIPWELVFADDGFSGFDFENRPALRKLREEIKTNPRSHCVVIEHIDRLSRNARWHQGFLLDEMTRYHVTPVFWKAFSSEIERAVLGTIAEEGMRSEISRMREGMILKAQSGRVTAKRPRFGYMFVDSNGQPSDKARQDTHYAIDPEKAKIVRWIFERVLSERMSLRRIAKAMNDMKIPPMFTGHMWCSGTIARIIADPVYKGEFFAHRWYGQPTGKFNDQGRPRKIMKQRLPEEWIKVEVPAIITPQEWKLAQEILTANQTRSVRNMKKREWLLSTFLKCERCHYAFVSSIGGGKNSLIRYYNCNGRYTDRALANNSACKSPYVRADELEAFVWGKIQELVTNPELYLTLLDEEGQDPQSLAQEEQLKYIEGQMQEATQWLERWNKAYGAGVIGLEEYEGYRAQHKKTWADLQASKVEISQKIEERLSKEEERRLILAGFAELRQELEKGAPTEEPSFEFKRKTVSQLLDTIWIDSVEKTIRFQGVLKSTYRGEETGFVFGSSPRWR